MNVSINLEEVPESPSDTKDWAKSQERRDEELKKAENTAKLIDAIVALDERNKRNEINATPPSDTDKEGS